MNACFVWCVGVRRFAMLFEQLCTGAKRGGPQMCTQYFTKPQIRSRWWWWCGEACFTAHTHTHKKPSQNGPPALAGSAKIDISCVPARFVCDFHIHIHIQNTWPSFLTHSLSLFLFVAIQFSGCERCSLSHMPCGQTYSYRGYVLCWLTTSTNMSNRSALPHPRNPCGAWCYVNESRHRVVARFRRPSIRPSIRSFIILWLICTQPHNTYRKSREHATRHRRIYEFIIQQSHNNACTDSLRHDGHKM